MHSSSLRSAIGPTERGDGDPARHLERLRVEEPQGRRPVGEHELLSVVGQPPPVAAVAEGSDALERVAVPDDPVALLPGQLVQPVADRRQALGEHVSGQAGRAQHGAGRGIELAQGRLEVAAGALEQPALAERQALGERLGVVGHLGQRAEGVDARRGRSLLLGLFLLLRRGGGIRTAGGALDARRRPVVRLGIAVAPCGAGLALGEGRAGLLLRSPAAARHEDGQTAGGAEPRGGARARRREGSRVLTGSLISAARSSSQGRRTPTPMPTTAKIDQTTLSQNGCQARSR